MTVISLNTRSMPFSVVENIRVDRGSELDQCIERLVHRGENVFLWGVRGVGKTFLVRLIEARLKTFPEILPVNVDVLGLPGFGRHDTASAFPEAVLLALCKTVWKELLDKPYSALRSRLDLREGEIRLESRLEQTIETIYQHAMASQRKARHEHNRSIGFAAGAKGELATTGWIEQEQPPILPFEFLEFTEEILAALASKEKTRVVALCDEANHLPSDQQLEILGRYIDLFASRRIQFLFVAGLQPWEGGAPIVPEGFDLVLELLGLQSGDAVQLLEKVLAQSEAELDSSNIGRALDNLGGNPRLLIEAANSVLSNSGDSRIVTARQLEAACAEVLAQLDQDRMR